VTAERANFHQHRDLGIEQIMQDAQGLKNLPGQVRTINLAAQVAVACAFVDQNHITRRFRQRIGLTPAAYASDTRHSALRARKIMQDPVAPELKVHRS
jgi:AraC-like DNA-binding protein